MLKGEKALVQELKELLSMSIAGHAVILTFQCAEYLRTLIKNDRRVDSRVCILDGVRSVRPRLVFTEEGINLTGTSPAVKGLRGIALLRWNQPPQKCYTSKPTKARTVTHFLSMQSQT